MCAASGVTGPEAAHTASNAWVVAERHFHAALALHEKIGAPGLLAYTRYELARLLQDWGRMCVVKSGDKRARPSTDSTVRALLGEAMTVARELGMEHLAGLAAVALGEATVRPAPAALPSGLTARELEVLRLLADGFSNPEIAERLVVSRKTVQQHTVNIYRKLGARGRTDAAAYAHRHGLVPPPAASL